MTGLPTEAAADSFQRGMETFVGPERTARYRRKTVPPGELNVCSLLRGPYTVTTGAIRFKRVST